MDSLKYLFKKKVQEKNPLFFFFKKKGVYITQTNGDGTVDEHGVPKLKKAFIQFATEGDAKNAIKQALLHNVSIANHPIHLAWVKPNLYVQRSRSKDVEKNKEKKISKPRKIVQIVIKRISLLLFSHNKYKNKRHGGIKLQVHH